MFSNSYRVFLGLLFFAPLAFGSVEPWSLAIMEVLAAAGLFIFLGENRKAGAPVYRVPGMLPLLGLAAYSLIQVIPMPAGVVEVLSPGTHSFYTGTMGLPGPLSWMTLSIRPKATVMELLRLMAAIQLYVLTVQLLSRRDLLKRTVAAVAVFAAIVAFLAVLQHLIDNRKIFWLRELTEGGTPFGPFVNRNHYAGFMAMVFPVILSVFIAVKPRVRYSTLRERLAVLFSAPETNVHILYGFAAILVATSVFLSLSRGGIVSLGLSLILLGVLLAARRTDRNRGLFVAAACLLIVLAVGWFGWGPVFERFGKITGPSGRIAELRPALWKDSIGIARDFLPFGSGFGTFGAVYPGYRTVPGTEFVDHAHNDYIEFLTTGGVFGLGLAGWFVIAVITDSFRTFLRRREPYSITLYTGSIAGMVAILIHGLTDFNLQIGSNGLYFFFLAGLSVSAAHTRLREGYRPTTLPEADIRPSVLRTAALAVLAAVLLLHAAGLAASFLYRTVKHERLRELDKKEAARVRDWASTAAMLDPLEPSYRFAVANAALILDGPSASEPFFRKAVRLDPGRAEFLQALGLVSAQPGRTEKLLKAGVNRDRGSTARLRVLAAWLLSEGRKDEALGVVREAISIAPDKTGDFLLFMVLQGLKEDEMALALPEKAGPLFAYADYLSRTDRPAEAGKTYRQAIRGISSGDARPAYFHRAADFFIRQDLKDDALSVAQKALSLLPSDAGIRLMAGRVYEKAGMARRAMEEYRQALFLDPQSAEARRRLSALESK